MGQLRAWAKRARDRIGGAHTLTQVVLWLVIAAGVSLFLTGWLEPLWPLRFVADHVPRLITWPLDALGFDPTTSLMVYGAGLAVAAVLVFYASEHHVQAREGQRVHLRERMVLRFLVTASFVAGFVGARAIVVMGSLPTPGGGTVDSALPIGEIWLQGYHLHHFFLGLLLVVAGWLAIFHREVPRRWTAILYGVGLGVFVDELGLLLTWGDYYARSSWFIAATFLSILVAGMLWTWGRAQARAEAAEETASEGGEDAEGAT